MTGPYYFMLECQAGCEPSEAPLEVRRAGELLAGTTERLTVSSTNHVLLRWTPAQPLVDATPLEAQLAVDAGTVSAAFQPSEPSGPTDPLAAAKPVEVWAQTPSGTLYSCKTPPQGGLCVDTGEQTWGSEAFAHPEVVVSLGTQNGWLFGVREMTSTADPDFLEYTHLTAYPEPGEEACFILDGWNLAADVKQSRKVCHTTEARTEAQRRTTVSTPSLADCSQPPVRVEDGKVAEELLGSWCNDRNAFCGSMLPRPDCETTSGLCPPPSDTDDGGVNGDDADGPDADGPDADGPDADVGKGKDSGVDDSKPLDSSGGASSNKSGGCSVGANDQPPAALLGMLLWIAYASRRKRTARSMR